MGPEATILAIETSCDDTCAAVTTGSRILANVVASQDAAHGEFGGVVPEVASRNHLELLEPTVAEAMTRAGVEFEDLDAVAVTQGPGLIGALLVGVAAAKALASTMQLPLIPVDHLLGHVAANFLDPAPLEPPFLCLIASGGHTFLAGVEVRTGFDVLGQTLDDAAGEAFDKGARMLGLGWPGGPALQRLAAQGDPDSYRFPVAMSRSATLDFSFSGVKTALAYRCRELDQAALERSKSDLAASYQKAIVEQLSAKVVRALDAGNWPAVALGGGVAANGPLRERIGDICSSRSIPLKLVDPRLCTDNAAIIGSAARFSPVLHFPDYLDLDASAGRPLR